MNSEGDSSMVSNNNESKSHYFSQIKGRSMLVQSMLAILFMTPVIAGGAPAGQRPVIPNPGEDLKLTKGLSVEKFFGARLEQSQCQEELKSAEAKYLSDKKELNDSISAKNPAEISDRAEEKMDQSRKILLAKTEMCGSCATQDLEKKIVITNKKEYWYITDGSCFIGHHKDEATLNQIFEQAVARLKNIKRYPGKSGGFKALLEFSEIDMETGELLPPKEKIEVNPFFGFAGVRGPVALGLPVGFWYIFKNIFESKEKDNFKEFVMRFETVKKPANFPTPELKIHAASGTESATLQREVLLLQGMWYVNNLGYFRYYTAADFTLTIPFGIDFARNTLLDTVLTLSEDSSQKE